MMKTLCVEDIVRVITNPRFHNRGKYIQGFFYDPDYVIRDVWRPRGQQELYRTKDRDEYEAELRKAKARIYAEALASLMPDHTAGPCDCSAIAAINFAIDVDDYFDRLEFLKAWRDGNTAEWPEFATVAAETKARAQS